MRRALAAGAAGHEVHHFRKRVEPRLIDQLVSALLADADRFTRSRVIAPRLAPTTDRQSIPADPFAWEVAEHEEALSRLWAAIYALRAELLAVERLISFGVGRQQVIQQTVTAAWRWALASTEAAGYTAAFGADATGGEVSAHDLVALAGWTPPLSPEQQSRLRAAAAGGADPDRFVAAAHAETELGHAWTDAFLASAGPGSPQHDTTNDTTRRHLRREDRHEYSLEVLAAFIAEYTGHKHGIRFYNRGIPDGYGWDRFFGLGPTPQLEEASRLYRYDTIFVLDPLDTFEDPDDIVWAKDREIRRVHELIVQGYYDAGYEPVFVAADSAAARLAFVCANLRLPKPSQGT